jgi:hypothetical protein
MADQFIGFKAFSGVMLSVVAGSLKIGYEFGKVEGYSRAKR